MLVATWKTNNQDLTEQQTIFDKLRIYGDLARKHLIWQAPSQGGRVVDDGNDRKGINKIQRFVDIASASEFLEKSIHNFVAQVVADTPNLAAVRRELVALSASFPASLQTLTAAARTFDGVESLAERMKSGKLAPTLVEVNMQLDQAVGVTGSGPLATSRAAYVAAKEVVGKEFGSLFGLYESKILRMNSAIATVTRRASNIVAEIGAWKFETCDFIKLPKDAPDSEMLAAARVIETSWSSFTNYSKISAELAAAQRHMPKVIQEKVTKIFIGFDSKEFENSLQTARVLLAHCCLASCIFTSKHAEDVSSWPIAVQKILSYIKSHLGIKPDIDINTDFARKLGIGPNAAKLTTAAKGKAKRLSTDSAASAASTASASTAAPSTAGSSMSAASGPERPRPPALKFRKQQR